MAGLGTVGRTVLGAGLLGAVGGKVWLYKKYRNLGHGGESGGRGILDSASNNRRVFARLPKRKQREVIYRKRAQLRDFEGITYSGYQPLGGRRRRSLWGRV